MGGKNHQPCKSYLENSTRLSRALSAAFIEMERGNVTLEDIILAELAGKCMPSGVSQVANHLDASKTALAEAKSHLKALEQQMQDNDFEDLPSLESTNLSVVGERFVQWGLADAAAWLTVQETMKKQGFSGMIEIFEHRLDELAALTTTLIDAVNANKMACESGEMMLVLEENREGNFKIEFAKLYQGWANFQQLFLASSLCSTELWYRFNRAGSLVLSSVDLVRAA